MLIIIIFVSTFMQDIYNYIPETHHVPTVYSAAAVLYSQSVLHVMLYRVLHMLCASTLALSAVCVHCSLRLFSVVPRSCAFPVCCSGTV